MVVLRSAVQGRRDPFLACHFLVEIRDIVSAGFAEVSGLESAVDVEEHREGGLNDAVHRLPGPTARPVPLVLRRGVTLDDDLWQWFTSVCAGEVDRRDVSVLLLDTGGVPRWRWTFARAFPVRWAGPGLRGADASFAVEGVELAHEGLDRLRSGRER